MLQKLKGFLTLKHILIGAGILLVIAIILYFIFKNGASASGATYTPGVDTSGAPQHLIVDGVDETQKKIDKMHGG